MTVAGDPALARLDALDGLGHEARVADDDHDALRLWLRLLSCTTQVEDEVGRRLRARFGISLARFDYLAQLHRAPEGLRMRELSRRLMVTGGNVTGLTNELAREGLVVRAPDAQDRRAWILRLTPRGRAAFEAMAREHERWILEVFGDLEPRALRQLHRQLGTVRLRVAAMRREAQRREAREETG